MVKTIIVGSVNNYGHNQVKHWIRSIKRNAPNCDTALIVYNMRREDAELIKKEGLTSFVSLNTPNNNGDFVYPTNTKNYNIVVERFVHIWKYLSMIQKYDYVVTTDVKDVIIQNDPTDYISKSKDIIVGAEWLKYCDEPWNKQNMNMSFGPSMYELVSQNPIYCAGVIAGKRQAVADFCLNIYLMCQTRDQHIPGGGGPDQAAMNLLISFDAYKNQTNKSDPKSGFIAHLGTSLGAILDGSGGIGESYKANPQLLDTYKKNLLYGPHSVKDNKIVNEDGIEYSIVHQYDRISSLKELIHNLYGDNNATESNSFFHHSV